MPVKPAPFQAEALRPFVSVTLHRIKEERAVPRSGSKVAEELSNKLDGLFEAFDIHDKNPHKVSPSEADRGIIQMVHKERLSLTGVWFKRIAPPPWLDVQEGPAQVRDTTNHILLLAIRHPYLAVLGTHNPTRELLSKCLDEGRFASQQLGFFAPRIDEETLGRAFVRGKTRFFALSGLHAPVETKPDTKSMLGLDLRKAVDPFSDQNFTFTSTVSILPETKILRKAAYGYNNRGPKYGGKETYAVEVPFLVGVKPEEHKVWTVQTSEFDHLMEEFRTLFDKLEEAEGGAPLGSWGYQQEGWIYLSPPIPGSELTQAQHAFDFGLELPPPVETGNQIIVTSELEKYQELWRAHAQLKIIESSATSSAFWAELSFQGDPVLQFYVKPTSSLDGRIKSLPSNYRPLTSKGLFHEAVTYFDTLVEKGSPLTIRYDSGHIIRGTRLFRLGWEDVLFDAWEWPFRPNQKNCTFYADLEKPASGFKPDGSLDKILPKGWEETLGTSIKTPGSLFEYITAFAVDLFCPVSDWHLCSDDGSGEVADFIYFEPAAGRLYLIHIKSAHGGKDREFSVKVYEEVVSQAVKNLRYLEVDHLRDLLQAGAKLSIAKASFFNGHRTPTGNRTEILAALNGYQGRLRDRRVIVFQPHVRKSVWEDTLKSWQASTLPTPKNQINRFLQLRTLLAEAEITCRKMGIQFEVWGEDDCADSHNGSGRERA